VRWPDRGNVGLMPTPAARCGSTATRTCWPCW